MLPVDLAIAYSNVDGSHLVEFSSLLTFLFLEPGGHPHPLFFFNSSNTVHDADGSPLAIPLT